jgi:hypothetical protein
MVALVDIDSLEIVQHALSSLATDHTNLTLLFVRIDVNIIHGLVSSIYIIEL